MSRPARFYSLFAPLRRPISSRSRSTPQRSRAARAVRLRLECLEERRVLAASWLGQIGGPADESGAGSRPFLDSSGNSYIEGYFSQTADFGPSLSSPTNPLTSAGGGASNDGFLAKYSPAGDLLWARRFGGAGGGEGVADACVDAAGDSVYMTFSSYGGSVDVDGDYLSDFTWAGDRQGYYDSFVLKLNAITGETLWSKHIGGSGNQISAGIAAADGKVYIAGMFNAATDFNPGPGTASLTPAGNGKFRDFDGFVLTLDSAGNYVNAWQVGGQGADAVNQIIAQDGSLYLKGTFEGTVDFAPGAAVSIRTSAGNSDVFIARYSTSGSQLNWVQTIGNAATASEYQLVSDADSLYLTGGVQGSIDFDPGPGTAVLNSVGGSDAVVATYSKTNGSLVWVKQFGGTGNDYGTNSVVDAGVLYVGGGYTGNVDFNPGVSASGEVSSVLGSQDGFLLQLNASSGEYQQVWTMGGPGADVARPVGVIHSTVDGHPTLYVSGGLQGTAAYPTGGSLTTAGGSDVFRMALDLPLAAQPAASPLQAANAATWEPQGGSAALAVENTAAKKDATRLAHEQVFEWFAPEPALSEKLTNVKRPRLRGF